MTFLSICGVALCAVFMILVIKEVRKDHTALLSLAVGILFFGIILVRAGDLMEYIRKLSEAIPNSTYVTVLLKALGITYAAAITQEICKSCGENGIAGYVEAVGKAEIVVICLPLIKELTDTALKYI